ncbi:MAG: hypothetical protein KDA65_13600 [Planctomycetaceae bacterium]|nr:hypothetical protein [Planctomycetaceae bacterium]
MKKLLLTCTFVLGLAAFAGGQQAKADGFSLSLGGDDFRISIGDNDHRGHHRHHRHYQRWNPYRSYPYRMGYHPRPHWHRPVMAPPVRFYIP